MPVEPGTYVTDKVRLISMMREGSMGQVWLAEHEALKTKVVVKFIAEDLLLSRPDARGRFEQEASTTAKIKSPHVIQIYDYGEMEDGTPYQVMELLQGESVGDRIDREGHLSATDVGEILRQAGNALDLAHGHGIIHRDIKPQNINLEYVHGELHAKVLDFGIAKRTLGDAEHDNLTMPGMVVGTLEYLSREVVSGSEEADYRVDLWALAVVAYKALTGKLPFTGPGMVQICSAIREGRFRRPSKVRPELPTAVDNWFIRAFFPDPEQRFTSAAQMARAFKEAIDESPSAGVYATSQASSERKPSQLLLAGAVGGGAVAILGALVVVAVMSLGDESSAPGPAADSAASPGSAVAATVPTAAPSASAAPTAVAPLVATAAPTATTAAATAAATATAAPTAATATASAAASAAPTVPTEGPGAMVQVPAGAFWMGCPPGKDMVCSSNMRPGRKIHVDAFAIDKTEVTVAAYGQCVTAGDCSADHIGGYARPRRGFALSKECNWGQAERADHPINCVDFKQAEAYCEYADKRLPTEAEWEKAARGTEPQAFPWGNDPPNCNRLVMNSGRGGCGTLATFAVGSKPSGASPYGALDMAGNVREWVADWYDHAYYRDGPTENPAGPKRGKLRVVRGGSWADAVAPLFLVATRSAYLPHARSPYMGFRCAKSGE